MYQLIVRILALSDRLLMYFKRVMIKPFCDPISFCHDTWLKHNSFIALGNVHVVDGKEWIVVCLLLILYIQLFNRLEGLQDIVNKIYNHIPF
jgi:hypothetical protein